MSRVSTTSCAALSAAAERCRDFDSLPEEVGPSVRSVWVIDPAFGPVTFITVLIGNGVVELVDFETDPDYWNLVNEDPDDL